MQHLYSSYPEGKAKPLPSGLHIMGRTHSVIGPSIGVLLMATRDLWAGVAKVAELEGDLTAEEV